MSNYPLPPNPPVGPFGPGYGGYQQNPSDALGPSRRAGVMLWILGGLGLTCGLCIISSVWVVPPEQITEVLRTKLTPEQQKQFGSMDLVALARIGVTVIFGAGVILAGTMLATAAAVRRGSRLATIIAIIPCVLILLWCALNILSSLVQLAQGGVVQAIANLLLWIVTAGIVGVTTWWLGQGLSASGRLAQQQQMYSQYWHYQQQQQQAAGYGYGAPTGAPVSTNPQSWMNLPPPPPTGAPLPPITPPPPPPSPAGGTGEGTDEPKM